MPLLARTAQARRRTASSPEDVRLSAKPVACAVLPVPRDTATAATDHQGVTAPDVAPDWSQLPLRRGGTATRRSPPTAAPDPSRWSRTAPQINRRRKRPSPADVIPLRCPPRGRRRLARHQPDRQAGRIHRLERDAGGVRIVHKKLRPVLKKFSCPSPDRCSTTPTATSARTTGWLSSPCCQTRNNRRRGSLTPVVRTHCPACHCRAPARSIRVSGRFAAAPTR